MENNVQNTIGQALSVARRMADDFAEKQASFLESYLNTIAVNNSRGALAAELLAMADDKSQFDWKAIYASFEEDEEDDDSDAAVKYAQAWHDGTFPVHILHDELLTDDTIRGAFCAYLERVADTRVSYTTYEGILLSSEGKFLSYRSGSGIACSTQRRYNGRSTDTPVGHFTLTGYSTPAVLFAQYYNAVEWARTLIKVMEKAKKKGRFSATVEPLVDQFIEALDRVNRVKLFSGDNYELRMISNDMARQLSDALDALDGLAKVEIREALVRYDLIYMPYLDGEPCKKAKRIIKKNGAVLSADLLKCIIKTLDSREEAGELWQGIALLDFENVTRYYIRKLHLMDDSMHIDDHWLKLTA